MEFYKTGNKTIKNWYIVANLHPNTNCNENPNKKTLLIEGFQTLLIEGFQTCILILTC
jgi:hypothetical protein